MVTSKSNSNIIIYTAISNNYDTLKEPVEITPNADYVCFSDTDNQNSDIWKIKSFPKDNLDPVRKCRYVKILPHKIFSEYEYSIWVDASIVIKKDLTKLIKKHFDSKNNKLILSKHPKRDCIYEEANICLKKNKDNKYKIRKQIEFYKNKNYPENNGLVETGVILRKHNNKKIKKIMNDWWELIIKFSSRDQLSFNYATWVNDFSYNLLKINFRDINDPYFELFFHKTYGLNKLINYLNDFVVKNKDKNKFHSKLYEYSKLLWNLIKSR